MPILRFPFCLRRESNLSALITKQRLGFSLHAVCARFASMVRQTVAANPELFLPVFLLFVWQITAIAVKPQTLGLALLMTLLLLVYGYRVLGKTPWLRRLGWVSPRQGFWLYSVLAGLASSAGVWSIARSFHESLGGVPPPHRVLLASVSGPMLYCDRSAIIEQLRRTSCLHHREACRPARDRSKTLDPSCRPIETKERHRRRLGVYYPKLGRQN